MSCGLLCRLVYVDGPSVSGHVPIVGSWRSEAVGQPAELSVTAGSSRFRALSAQLGLSMVLGRRLCFSIGLVSAPGRLRE